MGGFDKRSRRRAQKRLYRWRLLVLGADQSSMPDHPHPFIADEAGDTASMRDMIGLCTCPTTFFIFFLCFEPHLTLLNPAIRALHL